MRTVIGEDELLFREGLGRLLREGGFEVVAQAALGFMGPLETGPCDGFLP